MNNFDDETTFCGTPIFPPTVKIAPPMIYLNKRGQFWRETNSETNKKTNFRRQIFKRQILRQLFAVLVSGETNFVDFGLKRDKFWRFWSRERQILSILVSRETNFFRHFGGAACQETNEKRLLV